MARLPFKKDKASSNSFAPKSSFLETADYDEKSDTMTITFKSGSQYKYTSVGKSTWLSFQQSPDHSSFYANAIKGNIASIPIVRKVIGLPKDQPLKKLKQTRTLETPNGNSQRDGFKTIVKRAGLIPESLHR